MATEGEVCKKVHVETWTNQQVLFSLNGSKAHGPWKSAGLAEQINIQSHTAYQMTVHDFFLGNLHPNTCRWRRLEKQFRGIFLKHWSHLLLSVATQKLKALTEDGIWSVDSKNPLSGEETKCFAIGENFCVRYHVTVVQNRVRWMSEWAPMLHFQGL